MKNIPKLYKPQQLWNISLFEYKNNDLIKSVLDTPIVNFSPANKIRTEYHSSTGYADPFLFENKIDGYLYLFYEDEKLQAPAPICAKRTKNLKDWEDLGIVLKEDFHLSFPFVFQVEDEIYMLPETRQKDAVILYKSTNFPFEWKEEKVLLEGDKYVDSSLIKHNDMWYLFTTVWYGENNGLKIFYADNLLGEYKEHPLSPITDDIGFCRNGGTIFEHNNKLYRPAQNCTNYYGENLSLYEINKLTATEYHENKVADLIDKKNKWSKYGGHHFNMVNYKGKTLFVMDGITDDNWINNHTRKFFNYFYHKRKQ